MISRRQQQTNSRQRALVVFVLLVAAAANGCSAFAPPSHLHQPKFTASRAVPAFGLKTKKSTRTSTPSRSRSGTTELSAVAPAAVTATAGAIAGAISGGLFAGGLHAIAGPDHLAALLPRCCGQRWYKAGRVGALWGMGHGVSATLLGVVAFAIKRKLNLGQGVKQLLAGASHVTEIAVGLSLILIGVMGIREAREWEDEFVDGIQPQSLSAAAVDAADAGIKTVQKRATVFNGLLHGFSWDGAPSLAPAIAVATWSGNLAFLTSYAVGTMAAMTVTTTLIGEGTRRAGKVFNRPDIPQKLSLFSSMLAIAIGAVWCGLAFV